MIATSIFTQPLYWVLWYIGFDKLRQLRYCNMSKIHQQESGGRCVDAFAIWILEVLEVAWEGVASGLGQSYMDTN